MRPQVLIKDDFVYMRGWAWKPHSGTYGFTGGFTSGSTVGQLPNEAFPATSRYAVAALRYAPVVLLVRSDGWLEISGCGLATKNQAVACVATGSDYSRDGFYHEDLYLDGVVYPLL
jgi:hypothetical protein